MISSVQFWWWVTALVIAVISSASLLSLVSVWSIATRTNRFYYYCYHHNAIALLHLPTPQAFFSPLGPPHRAFNSTVWALRPQPNKTPFPYDFTPCDWLLLRCHQPTATFSVYCTCGPVSSFIARWSRCTVSETGSSAKGRMKGWAAGKGFTGQGCFGLVKSAVGVYVGVVWAKRWGGRFMSGVWAISVWVRISGDVWSSSVIINGAY